MRFFIILAVMLTLNHLNIQPEEMKGIAQLIIVAVIMSLIQDAKEIAK